MKDKLLIGTHDSVTGEQGRNILSLLVTPFSKTQSKTIREQYNAGCRYFDIRVKLIGTTWYCAHGLWTSKRKAYDIFRELNRLGDDVHVELTYEGTDKNLAHFKAFVYNVDAMCFRVYFTTIAVKYGKGSTVTKVKYKNIEMSGLKKLYCPPCKQCFLPLDGRSLHTYLPIPRLWKLFYFRKVQFNSEYYSVVDFL